MASPLKHALHLWFRLSRSLTGGARVVVLEGNAVLLVRHTYTPGLHLPGGGVEVGDTFERTAIKELREEAAVRPKAPLELFGLYLNRAVTERDHIALYVCRSHERDAFLPNREIAEAAFHPLHALPDDVTGATRRRLAEVTEARRPDPYW